MNLFEKFHEGGKTVVLITHDLNLVNYGERIIRLADGEVVGGKK